MMPDDPPSRDRPHTARPHRTIDLPPTRASLEQVLRWGCSPDDAPFNHFEIAQWCDAVWMAHQDVDAPPELEAALPIAGDVECQFDLYVAANYPPDEIPRLDHSMVRLPVAWFEHWLEQLDAT